MMLQISVVIPTYNRIDRLRYVIPSLLASDLRSDRFEIIVADSHSNDGTAEYLAEMRREFKNLRHLPGPYTGRAGARNAGIAVARGEIVLFTDADIIASPDLLSRHLARHEDGKPRAVVGLEVQVSSYEDYLLQSGDASRRTHLHPHSRKRLSWLYFLTGNASVPRHELDAVGGFDESFTGYGHEDLELGYRLQRVAKLPIEYEPRAINYHWHPVPFEEQKGRMELAGRSTALFFAKHPTLEVRALLGMTPVSLGIHGLFDRAPKLRDRLDRASAQPGLARTISYQYHYLTGVKAGLRDDRASR
jgi:glycosyltransferase involved in cell wall biosynthesis